jgi:phosphopantetheinyl transferase
MIEIFYENIKSEYKIYAAKIFDDINLGFIELENDISENEKDEYFKISNEKRKKEWLSIRILLKQILGKYQSIFYFPNGKPYLIADYNISISHTTDVLSIILSKFQNPGIDIEIRREKIYKLAHKFMKANEIDFFSGENRFMFIMLNWCAKETVFKMQTQGNIDFKNDIEIPAQMIGNSGKIEAFFNKENSRKEYQINYKFFNSEFMKNKYLMTWCEGS